LNFYFHTLVSAVAFLKGAMDGQWRSLDPLWIGDILVPTRIATALLGTLTVLLTFRIGLRWGERVALVAALAMAVLPPHVRESHFTLTDTPLTLFVTLTLLLSLRAAESPTFLRIGLAGVGVGLATAIKYNGFLAIVMPLVVAVMFARGRRLSAAMIALLGSAAAFLITAPYSVLDLPGFLNAFAFLMQSYNLPRPASEAAWIYIRHLRNWFTWPGLLPLEYGYFFLGVLALGLVTAYRRLEPPATRKAASVLLAFPLLYFAYISYQGSLIYGRYLLPMASMMAVGLAVGLVGLASTVAARLPRLAPAALPALLVLVFLPQAGTALSWLHEHERRTTLEQTASWLVNRLGPDDQIVMDGAAVQVPPRVRLQRVRRLIDKTADQYVADGITHLVTSSDVSNVYEADPVNRAEDREAHRALLARGEVVQTFSSTATRPGPTLSVLKLTR
jgi:4-amino-4-deoxy-L-arabinose transferase-like glycosyltransferase